MGKKDPATKEDLEKLEKKMMGLVENLTNSMAGLHKAASVQPEANKKFFKILHDKQDQEIKSLKAEIFGIKKKLKIK